MKLKKTTIKQKTHRLIASRYPTVGVFDSITSPEEIHLLNLLEGWTNDRISSDLGVIHHMPKEKWVYGASGAHIVMAAFCHPSPAGSRFNNNNLGAWYASFDIETAISETVHHHTRKLQMADNFLNAIIQMRELVSTANGEFVDIRDKKRTMPELYMDEDYAKSQSFAESLRSANENGILYDSIRLAKGTNVVIFEPKIIPPVTQGRHFEYRWNGTPEPEIFELKELSPNR